MAAAPHLLSPETLDHKRYFFSHLGLTERLLERCLGDCERVELAVTASVLRRPCCEWSVRTPFRIARRTLSLRRRR